MKKKLDLTKLVMTSLLLAGLLNIPVSIAETPNTPIDNGLEKLKKFFSSLQSDSNASNYQANLNKPLGPNFHDTRQKPSHKEETIELTKVQGSYENLSKGNKKIAKALFNAQIKPVINNKVYKTNQKTWSLDEIAAANNELNSWGQVFNHMKQDKLLKESNLGQIIRNHSDIIKPKNKVDDSLEDNLSPKHKEAIVITNANGEYLVINRNNTTGPGSL